MAHALNDREYERAGNVIRWAEAFPSFSGDALPVDHKGRQPVIGILKNRVGPGQTAEIQPCTYSREHDQYVPAASKAKTVHVTPMPGRRIFWNVGELVFCYWLPGMGYVFNSEMMWGFGRCGLIEPYSLVVVQKAQKGTGKKRVGDPDGVESNFMANADNGLFGLSLNTPGSGPRENDIHLENYAFTSGFTLTSIQGLEGDYASGPVPIQTEFPVWTRYDPDAEEPPSVGDLWGPTRGKTYLVREPTFERQVARPHKVEASLVSSDPLLGCNCEVESGGLKNYTETVAFGWRVLDVDEDAGLCFLAHQTAFETITLGREGSTDDYDNFTPEDERTDDTPIEKPQAQINQTIEEF